jgi:hypothetical protein
MRREAIALVLVAAGARADPPSLDAPPSTLAVSLDKGAFKLFDDGLASGEETFEVARVGREVETRYDRTHKIGSARVKQRGIVRSDATFRLLAAAFEDTLVGRGAHRRTLERTDGHIALTVDGVPASASEPPRSADVFVSPDAASSFNVVCKLAGKKPRTLVSYPDAKLSLSPLAHRSVERPATGGPEALQIDLVQVDLGARHYEVACEAGRAVVVRVPKGAAHPYLREPADQHLAMREGYDFVVFSLRGTPALPPHQTLPKTK